MRVWFCERVEDHLLKFAVIVARYQQQWVFCKHRLRDTYECPGGHREKGESIEQTARRELYEETGALEFTLHPAGVYAVESDHVTYGGLFYAEIQTLGELPPSEIEAISLWDNPPDRWTYPEIQPALLAHMKKRFLSE